MNDIWEHSNGNENKEAVNSTAEVAMSDLDTENEWEHKLTLNTNQETPSQLQQ